MAISLKKKNIHHLHSKLNIFINLCHHQREEMNFVSKFVLTVLHIVPELSEGTWLSSLSAKHFFGSSGAKDQLPGH